MKLQSVFLAAILTAVTANGKVIYVNNFENTSDPLTEWSFLGSTPSGDPAPAASGIAVTPGTTQHLTDKFFGQFSGSETTSLTLHNIPSSTTWVRLSFDLYIIRTWDGIGSAGPDTWKLTAGGGQILLDTTFSNMAFANQPYQSYPGTYPTDAYPAQTGAFEKNTLGFAYGGYGAVDAVYRFANEKKVAFAYSYSDSGGDLVITFIGINLQNSISSAGHYDESWGLDNIQVEVLPSSVCLYTVIGDLNDDCKVDLSDFALMAEHWLIDCYDESLNTDCVLK